MRKYIACFLFLSISSANAREMPFEQYYGNYGISSCKRLSTKSDGIDVCSYEKFSISLAPPDYGSPTTHFSFSGGKNKANFVGFTKLSLIAKNEKYQELKDGTSHWWAAVPNDTTRLLEITNSWVKVNFDGTLNVKIRKIESSSSSESDEIKEIFNHEITLKKQ